MNCIVFPVKGLWASAHQTSPKWSPRSVFPKLVTSPPKADALSKGTPCHQSPPWCLNPLLTLWKKSCSTSPMDLLPRKILTHYQPVPPTSRCLRSSDPPGTPPHCSNSCRYERRLKQSPHHLATILATPLGSYFRLTTPGPFLNECGEHHNFTFTCHE